MKRFLCLFLSFSICYLASGRPAEPTFSEPFDEPTGLGTKLFLSANGNTLFFNFTRKDGIEINVYDRERKKISHRVIHSRGWEESKLHDASVRATYNIGGKVVMFLQYFTDRQPVLYRMIFSPETGALEQQQKIETIEKYSAIRMMSVGTENFWQEYSFYVEKDPSSDAYAVVSINAFPSKKDQKFLITQYDGEHKQIARAYYTGDEVDFKYTIYLGMVVKGTEEVGLCMYGRFNGNGGKGSTVVMSRLRNGKFSHQKIENTENLQDITSGFIYNTAAQQYQLLITAKADQQPGYFSFSHSVYFQSIFLAFSAVDFSLIHGAGLDATLVDKFDQTHFGTENYRGAPFALKANNDGSCLVMMEEKATFSGAHGTGSMNLGDIGMLVYDSSAKPVEGYVFRKVQGMQVPPVGQDVIRKGRMNLGFPQGVSGFAREGFFSYLFVGNRHSGYVIVNDNPSNFNVADNEKIKGMGAVSDAETICYHIQGGAISKSRLLGGGAETGVNRVALLSSMDYSEATGDCVMMCVENSSDEKKAKIAWVNLK